MKTFARAATLAAFSAAAVCAADAGRMDEIVIEAANKSSQKLSEITANVEVITAQEIEERHYTGVAEALASLAGVEMTANGGIGQSTSVYVRGMEGKRTLVLVDGVRANDATGLNGAMLEHFSIADVERIEVIKGAQSGIWGADASAGVINIVLKKGLPHHAAAYAEFGSYGTKRSGATVSHATDRWDLSVGLHRTLTDGISSAEPSKISPLYGIRAQTLGWERDRYRNDTVDLKGGLSLSPQDRIELSLRKFWSFVAYDSSSWSAPYVTVDAPDGPYTTNKTVQRFGNLAYVRTQGDHAIRLYGANSDFFRSQYGGYTGFVNEFGLQDNWRYSENGEAAFGILKQFFVQKKSGGDSLDRDDVLSSIFATDTHRFNDGSTVVTESVRRDAYSTFRGQTTGKIGIRQTLPKSFWISANYGTAYDVPTLYQLYGSYVGNAALCPESVRSFDATAGYKALSLTYFYTTVKNLIDYDYALWTYNNIAGTSTLQGYEIKVSQPLTEALNVNTAYTRLSAVDGNGQDLQRRPHDSLKMTTDWYPNEAWHVGGTLQYIGTRYDDKAQSVQTGQYVVVGGVADYAFTPSVGAYARIDNLLNRFYQTVDGYATPGRSVYAGLRVSY